MNVNIKHTCILYFTCVYFHCYQDLLGEWNIPELGLFDLDYSSPRAFIRSVKDGIERAHKKDWKEWGKGALVQGMLKYHSVLASWTTDFKKHMVLHNLK